MNEIDRGVGILFVRLSMQAASVFGKFLRQDRRLCAIVRRQGGLSCLPNLFFWFGLYLNVGLYVSYLRKTQLRQYLRQTSVSGLDYSLAMFLSGSCRTHPHHDHGMSRSLRGTHYYYYCVWAGR